MTFVTQGIALHCNRASSVLEAVFFFFFFFALMISWLEFSVVNQMFFLSLIRLSFCVLNTSLKENAVSQSQSEHGSNLDHVHGTRNIYVTNNGALCVHGAKWNGLLSLSKKLSLCSCFSLSLSFSFVNYLIWFIDWMMPCISFKFFFLLFFFPSLFPFTFSFEAHCLALLGLWGGGLVESLKNGQFFIRSSYVIYEKGYVVKIAFFFSPPPQTFCFTIGDNDLCLFTLRYFFERVKITIKPLRI